MSRDVPPSLVPSLVFLQLPDLQTLLSVTVSLQEDQEPKSRQIRTCRELVLLYPDVLASPALDSLTDITVVMSIQFFHKGIVQAFGHRRHLQLGSPQRVFPGDFQRCLSYSLIVRLAPSWNKAGLYLVSGRDFLTSSGRLNAVSLELSTSDSQLCLSIQASSVRIPPVTLQDFDLPPLVLRKFCSDPDAVLNSSSKGGAIWCHVLPSMKKGQIVTISRRLPSDGPFRTYTHLQSHWNCLYGYRLPELPEEEAVYCSVHFRPLGGRLFTYPLSCIRLQPAQRCAQGDLQGATIRFLSDVRTALQSVCGAPARLTSRPRYGTAGLLTAAAVQVLDGEQINLTTSCPLRSVLSQPPPPPGRPSFGSQPLVPTRSNQQGGAHEPAAASSLLLHLDARFLSSSSSSSSSSVPPPPPKLVPIFKSKPPSRHVDVPQLQKEQQGGGGAQTGRVSLPVFRRSSPTAAPSSRPSLPAASVPVRPPPAVPRFHRRPKRPQRGADPLPSARPQVQFISTLSPASRPKPGLILPPKPAAKPKPKSSLKAAVKASAQSDPQDPEPPAGGAAEPQTGSKKRVAFNLKKSKAAAQDVEEMARSNQLSRLSSASLSTWLRLRGVPVPARLRKDRLLLKVMSCLAEA